MHLLAGEHNTTLHHRPPFKKKSKIQEEIQKYSRRNSKIFRKKSKTYRKNSRGSGMCSTHPAGGEYLQHNAPSIHQLRSPPRGEGVRSSWREKERQWSMGNWYTDRAAIVSNAISKSNYRLQPSNITLPSDGWHSIQVAKWGA